MDLDGKMEGRPNKVVNKIRNIQIIQGHRLQWWSYTSTCCTWIYSLNESKQQLRRCNVARRMTGSGWRRSHWCCIWICQNLHCQWWLCMLALYQAREKGCRCWKFGSSKMEESHYTLSCLLVERKSKHVKILPCLSCILYDIYKKHFSIQSGI